MAEFMRGDVCRRVILDEVMDGRMDRIGCEEGEEACDVCEGIARQASTASTSITAMWQEQGEHKQQKREQVWQQSQVRRRVREEGTAVKEQLEASVGRCALCCFHLNLQGATAGKQGVGHKMEQCMREEAKEIRQEVRGMREGIKYERFSCCYHCGVP
jgi:hypothetical protein